MAQIIAESFLGLSLFIGMVAHAEDCVQSKNSYFRQLNDLVADCEARMPSPDGQKMLLMKPGGDLELSFTRGESFEPVGYKVEPPAMASWAPDSKAFIINDGEGSGMSSTFRLFRVDGAHATQVGSVHQVAVSIFRKALRCPSSAAHPNVWGIGWSSDGKRLFLLVQATVNESCGGQDAFIGLIVSATDGSVISQLTKKQTKQKFRSMLPHEFYEH
jgi:hypothetical protein